jgi:cellulose synthase/poly-beta-1,6-N-acetylglucosamine synthase-like glycosyltransferase
MLSLKIILSTIEGIAFVYFAFATLYIMIFGIASLFPRKSKIKSQDKMRRFAVMIPGYKEDRVIIDVAQDALLQDYPKELYEVIVIADQFKADTLEALRALPIRVVEVVFEVSKKSKALNKCMEVIGDEWDIAMILDADNIMAHDVLTRINDAFNKGFSAVQGHRMAKNTNTTFAILDAVSEEINNSIFRKGHRVLGLSSALIGSGMAIDYTIYKRLMAGIDSVGEDKELEMKLLQERILIEYEENAHIYDEKTQKSEVFVNQRRRWIAAQLSHFREFFFDGLFNLLKHGNLDYFDKVIQMIQPPRILLSGSLFIITVISGLVHFLNFEIVGDYFSLGFYYWFTAFILTALTLSISVPGQFYNKKTFIALLSLPYGFILMVISLLKIKGASKKFIHTTHSIESNTIKKGSNKTSN